MASEVLIQKDWEIIGFVVSGYVGVIIITLSELHIIANMRKKPVNKQLKYSTIISLTSALIFCITVGLFRTDIIFKIDFAPQKLGCIIAKTVCYAFYMISKSSMYTLFTYKLEMIFDGTMYKVSHTVLRCTRTIIIILTIILVISTIFWGTQQIKTPKYDINLCTNNVGSNIIANCGMILFITSDFILQMFLLWLFCSKLYKTSKMYFKALKSSDQSILTDEQKKELYEIPLTLMKQTILVCTAMFSTFFFAFIGSLVLWSIGWFIPLDMVFNSLSIHLAFKFADNLYNKLCKPCICCCQCCITCCSGVKDNKLSTKTNKNSTQQNVEISIKHSVGTESTQTQKC